LKEKKENEKRMVFLPLAFILFLALFWVVMLLLTSASAGEESEGSEAAVEAQCLLDYGESECIDGFLSVPFYNSGKKTISSAQITIPILNGTDVAQINEPLAPNKTGAVQLTLCEKVDSTKPLKLNWCCEKCYKTEMVNQSKTVTINK